MAEDLPIDLVPLPEVPKPPLPGMVVVRPEVDTLIDGACAELMLHARNCVRVFGDFHLAVSPDPMVEPFVRRLMYDPNYREFPWQKTRLWVVDDLAVPMDDPRSRSAAVQYLIAEQSGMDMAQFHPMDAAAPDAAEKYEALLREHLGWREKGHDRLDYVIAGLTAEGGVGRRGPEAGRVSGDLVERYSGGAGEPDLLAMSIDFLNASRMIVMIATGREVRDAVAAMGSEDRRSAMPAAYLAPLAGDLKWYVDFRAGGAPEA